MGAPVTATDRHCARARDRGALAAPRDIRTKRCGVSGAARGDVRALCQTRYAAEAEATAAAATAAAAHWGAGKPWTCRAVCVWGVGDVGKGGERNGG